MFNANKLWLHQRTTWPTAWCTIFTSWNPARRVSSNAKNMVIFQDDITSVLGNHLDKIVRHDKEAFFIAWKAFSDSSKVITFPRLSTLLTFTNISLGKVVNLQDVSAISSSGSFGVSSNVNSYCWSKLVTDNFKHISTNCWTAAKSAYVHKTKTRLY